MEEVARKDFQEEPGMMERSTHLFFVLLVKDVIVVIIVVVMFAFLSAISELSAWISSTPHLAQVSLSLSQKKVSDKDDGDVDGDDQDKEDGDGDCCLYQHSL